MMQAKVKVSSVLKLEDSEQLTMEPVTYTSEENKSYSRWTPSGKITLMISNPELFGKFSPGEEYVVNFTKA